MTTWLYCLLEPPHPDRLPAALAGLDGAPVRALATDGIEAWVSTVTHSIVADVERARAHNDVIDLAMSTGRTPLPARFGQRFADDAACVADIGRRRPALKAALHRVAGTVELGVLLVTEAPSPAPAPVTADVVDTDAPQPGHRYLDALRARAAEDERWRERVLEQISTVEESVRSLVRASSPPEVGRGRVAGSIAHLVTATNIAAYRAAAAAAAVAPGFRIIIAGPRAPYSFCSADDEAGTILAT